MHRCKPHRELIQRDLTCTMSKVWLNLWSPVSATGPEPKPPPSNLYHGQGKRTTAGVFWLQPKHSEAEASRFLAAWDMCFHIHMHHPCVYSWVYISIQRRKNKVFPRETGRVTEKTVFTAENWDILSLSHSLSLFTPRLCPPKFGGRCCIISKGFSSSAQPRVGWSTERLSVTFYLRFACRTNRRKTSAQSYIYLKTPPPSPPKKRRWIIVSFHLLYISRAVFFCLRIRWQMLRHDLFRPQLPVIHTVSWVWWCSLTVTMQSGRSCAGWVMQHNSASVPVPEREPCGQLTFPLLGRIGVCSQWPWIHSERQTFPWMSI